MPWHAGTHRRPDWPTPMQGWAAVTLTCNAKAASPRLTAETLPLPCRLTVHQNISLSSLRTGGNVRKLDPGVGGGGREDEKEKRIHCLQKTANLLLLLFIHVISFSYSINKYLHPKWAKPLSYWLYGSDQRKLTWLSIKPWGESHQWFYFRASPTKKSINIWKDG